VPPFVPWLETVAVVLLAAAGVFAGARLSRLRRPWWLAGVVIPLAVVGAIGLARHEPRFASAPPIAWLVAGRRQFISIALACTVLLTTPLSRLAHRRQQVLVAVFLAVVVVSYAVLPVLLPALLRARHESLATIVDEDGVCRQTNNYVCGPAAAVTALHRLGLHASVGELAVLAYSTPISGTPPDLLAHAIETRYGGNGVSCEYRAFDSLAELRDVEGMTLAVVKLGFLVDHYVAVLDVTTDEVFVGDPIDGKKALASAEFAERWRRTGVVVRRK
jgi:hypothetical protein